MKNILNIYSAWLFLVFVSFGYELPLINLSSADRLNPRLFDISLILGLFVWMKVRFKVVYDEEIYKIWFSLVVWFTFCVLVTAILSDFPTNINSYMFYYLFEYVKGLILLTIFMSIPRQYLDVERIFKAILLGGIITSVYCVYEINFGTSEIVLSDALTIIKPEGYVWGPFVGSYFQIAMYLPLTFIVAVGLYCKTRKIIYLLASLFLAWPTLYTGSRTHLFMLLFTAAVFFYFTYRSAGKRVFALCTILILAPVLMLLKPSVSADKFETISRMESLENTSEHSIIGRLLLFESFDVSEYDNGDLMPFIGGGFYVAPVNGGFRISYGFHNIYVFAFEQSGLVGLLLFILLIYVFLKKNLRYLNYGENDSNYHLILAVFAYMVASFIIGMSGHSFWRGFSTSNLNTLRLLIMAVSCIYITEYIKNVKKDTIG
ncbi:hypothetical protein R7035_07580 [Vibrio sp. 1731]|uniref:hypothetical protein n=1 Tax=Vibrio sp. 1731 TaxID=3074573 RepID=UPI0021D23313|nr:hypothetical protein [Vibrio sp. 1731]MDW2113371.1 hypothetical protein [Vibrio sp. 1731]